MMQLGKKTGGKSDLLPHLKAHCLGLLRLGSDPVHTASPQSEVAFPAWRRRAGIIREATRPSSRCDFCELRRVSGDGKCLAFRIAESIHLRTGCRVTKVRPSRSTTSPATKVLQHDEEDGLHHSGRRQGHPPVSADQVPLQAGRAGGGQVSADRHPAVELHQQRAEPHLRADAVQLGQPAPAHPQTYTFDPFDGGFVEILAAQQTHRQRRLVSGHGRRRAAEPPLHRAAGHRLRADPLRRPALPDGLPGDDRTHVRFARPT